MSTPMQPPEINNDQQATSGSGDATSALNGDITFAPVKEASGMPSWMLAVLGGLALILWFKK